jgi:hypothetical protein
MPRSGLLMLYVALSMVVYSGDGLPMPVMDKLWSRPGNLKEGLTRPLCSGHLLTVRERQAYMSARLR